MILVLVFLLGLAVGSFLNAFMYRMEQGESALKGRSYCPHCKHTLAWYDLIPLLSFALLQGRCRYCEKSISLQYPIVELVTGLLFLGIFFLILPWLNQGTGNLISLSFPLSFSMLRSYPKAKVFSQHPSCLSFKSRKRH